MPYAVTSERRSTGSARGVWLGFLLIAAAVEAVLALADAGLIGSPRWRPLAYQYGGFWAGLLHGWTPNYTIQPATMFASHIVLHAGWQHLLGNLVTLGWLGLLLEQSLGRARFATLFALSALGGGLGFGLLATSPRPMVGASGAIMGLVAVWIAAEARDMSQRGAGQGAVLRMMALRVALIGGLNWLAWILEAGALAWEAHLGGFLAAALAMALTPALRPAPR